MVSATSGSADVAEGQFGEQKSAFNEAFTGYKNARDSYSTAKQELDSTRSKTRARLLEKAKTFMLHADRSALKYLDVLKARVEQVNGIPEDKRSAMLTEINEDSRWLLKTQADIERAKSIDELRDIAKRFREHWRNYRGVSKRMTGLILHEKLGAMIIRAEGASSKVSDMVDTLKLQGKDTGELEELLGDFNERIDIAKKKNEDAKTYFESIPVAGETSSSYQEGMKLIREANLELKEAHSTLSEISKELQLVTADN
jgi:exonuclease VII small subunit